MHPREVASELEHTPHTPIALADEMGRLYGWSPAFADACALTPVQLYDANIADLWPELDATRWAMVWSKIHTEGAALIIPVAPRSKPGCSEVVELELELDRFVFGAAVLTKIEIRRTSAWRLHLMQQEILQAMAYGTPFKGIMEMLCRKAELLVPSVVCSVLEVDRDGRLRHIASPSLPKHYSAAVDGMPIGPKCGSCGTAAYRAEPVEVTDIASDPLWEDYRDHALALGLRACWSSPIKAADGRVMGAFAFYYPRSRGPTRIERQIVATCLHLCVIALEHEETRARAYEHAYRDPLTGLANRARFNQRISESLAIVAETGQRIVVQYLGLDRFRSTNEMLGYAAGDELLKCVANRLTSLVKDHDAVARIGGDEFALIHVGNMQAEEIAKRARRIINLVSEPIVVAGQRLQLGASVGIAIGPTDADGADDLLQDAALAMRRVKELGRGSYYFYQKELNERMQRRRRTKADLRHALTHDQLELHYQPIFDLQTGRIQSAEALLRWHHPDRGMVLPSEFIPLAEQCGLIEPIGAWVVRKACFAAAKWPAHVAVAVNLSPAQFDSPGLVEAIASSLQESGLDPSRLELEITESVLLGDSPLNMALLDQLNDLGVSIALDDFGTGYSSLSYLHRFSFDRVKIDHSFIRDIAHNEGSLKIVRAIVMLAHSLGLKITAEGVETSEQLAAVRGEGCDAVQGYYTGTPIPLGDFLERLASASDACVSAA